jgi:hypothetical protein
MVNQSIALQARAPVSSGGGNSFAQNMQIMNMMAQRTAAERQAQQAQQTMGIQAAQETDRAALAAPQLSTAQANDRLAQLKLGQEYNVSFRDEVNASVSPQDLIQRLDILQQKYTDEPVIKQGIATVKSMIPQNITPAEFNSLRDNFALRSIKSETQMKNEIKFLDVGGKVIQQATNPYTGKTETLSTIDKTLSPGDASAVTYVPGEGGAIPLPTHLGGGGGAPSAAPAGNAPTNFNDAWSKIKQLEGGMKDGQMQVSSKGAVGPAQLMLETAKDAAKMANVPWDESKYRTDPAYNEKLGKAYYASRVAARNGDFTAAALDYHTGMGNVDKGKIGPKGREYAANFAGAAPAAQGTGGIQLGTPVPGTAKPKELTVAQENASYNVRRVLRAAKKIQEVVGRTPSANAPGGVEAAIEGTPLISGTVNFFREGDRQIVSAAQRDLLDGLLFLATGAAYNKEQLTGQMESYIPQYSDKPVAIEAKRERLAQLVMDAKARVGRGWTPEMDTAAKALMVAPANAMSSKTGGAAAKSPWTVKEKKG